MAGRRVGWEGKGRKGGRCREPERAETVRRFVTVTRALTSSGECTREGRQARHLFYDSRFAPLLLLPSIFLSCCVVKKKKKERNRDRFFPPPLTFRPCWCSVFEFPRTGVIFFFFFLSKEDSLLERFSSVSTTFSSLLHSVDTYSGEEDYSVFSKSDRGAFTRSEDWIRIEEKRKGGFVPRGWWLLPVLPVAHLLRETPLYSVLGILAAVIRSKSDLNPSVRVDDRSVSPSVLKEKNKKMQRKL